MKQLRKLPTAIELIERIGWLIKMRWAAVVGVVCAIELSRRFLPVQLALGPLYAVTAGLALYNSALILVVRHLSQSVSEDDPNRPISSPSRWVPRVLLGMDPGREAWRAGVFANGQISLDLFFLTLLLHFSGGIENPFTGFFIFHIIIAGILLSRWATYFQAALGLAMFSTIAMGECFGVLEHYALNGLWSEGAFRQPVVVGAQIFVLGATLFLAAYMCSTIAARLRRCEREDALRSEKLARKVETLKVAREAAAESEYAKSKYLRKVAHELRGPLATIQTVVTMVEQGYTGEISEKTKDMLGRTAQKAKDLSAVTVDLLTLSRAKDARLETKVRSTRPGELVSQAIREVTTLAEQAGVSISLEVTPDLGWLEADPVGLQQLVNNLLTNAIRYTARDGKIAVRLLKIGDALRLSVEDTGIGIPQEDLLRVFDEFFRSQNAREATKDGTGLGLAIVKAIAEQHKGSVSIESTVGRGTCVTVELPWVEG